MKPILVTPQKTLDVGDNAIFTGDNNSNKNLKTSQDSRSPSSEETECSHCLISRKTLRGRKEKISLPKNKLKCEICLEFSDFSKEDLISCSTCKCIFHKSCYDQYQIYNSPISEISSYKCQRCFYALNLNKSIIDFRCFICDNSNGVLSRNNINGLFYHKLCIYFLNEFKDLEGEDICKERIRKLRHKNSCRYCGEKLSLDKAVIKCKKPKCKEFYHIPCAIEKGMIFDLNYMKKYYNVSSFNEIPFYCSNHNKKVSFMYKNQVINNNSHLRCQKGLFKNELDINENNEQNILSDSFGKIIEKKFRENNATFFESVENKLKNIFKCNNSFSISIVDEENVNDKNNEICLFHNEKSEQNEKCVNLDIHNLDNSFEYKENEIFNLKDETLFKENETNENGEFLLDSSENKFKYHYFGENDNISQIKDDNDANDNLMCRQKSLSSLLINM
jgi:hypothetical protein